MRVRTRGFDYILLGVSAFLLILGILILNSSSASISQQNFGSPTHILFHQIKYGVFLGLLLGGMCFFLSITVIRKWTPLGLLVILVLMGMALLPKIGLSFGGASRWLNLGPISFQPSEFLKIGFILYLAAWISKREPRAKTYAKVSDTKMQSKMQSKRRHLSLANKFWPGTLFDEGLNRLLVPFLIIIGLISLLLIFQPDIGTLGIIALVAILMYFTANTRIFHTVFLILAGVAGLIVLIGLAPYRLNRIFTFLKAELDPMGISYQINQALIAIGSGGIWGRGLGMGIQKFGFLPHSISDSIFATFAEETGFIGSLFLITLFFIFAWQGFKISRRSSDKFSQILALGITSWIVIQGFVNIGSIIGILPLTGIPLPFISYGGSHLIAELMGVGILLNISKHSTNN
ncbi:MAG: hypothetical protein CO031_03000 [Candidatus Nealsonbacteria bacterium CG_4_9_14_0_2_um_filter_37_38]|uniref:Probable peptidoglycan glycosyltransferase FtsW n=1 Tax=Candidatus Nealsonbacteria bacterium CG_4_10_14_0_8_um_filter_37_14 TaxID=1974684 RepID=A0A2M7R650_9BACT|nr:MAG: hypothetical protein COV63_00725 [Candidatus Nealsonbacteria bacterium CG11_big_fil_rev_8_21_14_0_20_37_68]PIW92169.1 MAG: hypothetical protein COZ89_01335 [Candidatus Nealsonbacteria bacterium CG_4_8_14_3_um_filter_37_23]PIY89010.1 MAG: hypothetical protein COY73_02175 [Candidatus Nealsonbacteria bacterium CG_4_10_14_0_8_um_filter_37_14]PJC51384.1 MAG: hypothetical protein CO031_03000 [Candidatus Nealsonbacteria bacterium CG_4_9_14_0_2_um_filter_37_38]